MKNTLKILLCSIGLIFLSCNENFNTGIQGSGNITKEKRTIAADFEKIASSSGVTVIVEQGSPLSLEVEADDNLLQYVITKIEFDDLVTLSYVDEPWRTKSEVKSILVGLLAVPKCLWFK